MKNLLPSIAVLSLLCAFPNGPAMADSTDKAIKVIKAYADESKNLITTAVSKKGKLNYSRKTDTVTAEYVAKIKEIRSFEAPGKVRSSHIADTVEDYFKKQKVLIRTHNEISDKELKGIMKELDSHKSKIMEGLNRDLISESGGADIPSAVPIVDDSPYEGKGIYDR